jgi:hypothetical protein
MALTTILIRQEDLASNTIIGGSVDVDRYLQAIKACQNIYIKPLLGTALYNKICDDFENTTLTGLYLELYDSFVKELTIHGSAEIYLSQGAYMVSNSGITKTKTDTSETISKEEIDYLVEASRKLYRLYETEFLKWIKENDIVEYDKPNKPKSKTIGGWLLRKKGDC